MKKRFRAKKIKILSTIIMLGIVFYVPVFAENNTMGIEDLGVSISYIINFLSRGWMIFALLAGKLMTNEFVYGSFMHLDIFLWKIWNIMKNIANYTLGFMFLFYIIKHLFVIKETPGDFIKTKIVGFLVAGILIQASWFLIGATLDIVTITTSAIAAFPGQFIEESGTTQVVLKKEFQKIKDKRIVLDMDKSLTEMTTVVSPKKGTTLSAEEKKENEAEFNRYLDSITPSYDNAAGPLIFLGSSILKFHEYGAPSDSIGNWTGLFSAAFINIFILILFTIAMILIFIVNLVRVVIIWMFICLSPVLILFTVLEKMKVSGSSEAIKLPERLSFNKIITIIFKPVIYTAYLSLILIFMTSIYRIMEPGAFDMGGVNVSESNGGSNISAGELGGIELHGIKNSLADMILYLFAVFLCWQLVKLSVKGVPFVDGLLETLTKTVESGVTNLPIIPIGGGKGVGYNAMSASIQNKMRGIREETGIDMMSGKFDIKGEAAFEGIVNEKLGISGSWTLANTENFNNKLANRNSNNGNKDNNAWNEFFQDSRNVANGLTRGLSIENNGRKPQLEKLLKMYKGKSINIAGHTGMIKINDIGELSVDDYFKKEENKKVKRALIASMYGIGYNEVDTKHNNRKTKPLNTIFFKGK